MSPVTQDLIPSNAVAIVAGQPCTDSLMVAKIFGKRHDHVLRDISALDIPEDFRLPNFGETSRTVPGPNGGTRKVPMVSMTRDGFCLVAFGFTGPKAMQFKIAYIERFNAMEREIAAASAAASPAARSPALAAVLNQLEKVVEEQAVARAQQISRLLLTQVESASARYGIPVPLAAAVAADQAIHGSRATKPKLSADLLEACRLRVAKELVARTITASTNPASAKPAVLLVNPFTVPEE